MSEAGFILDHVSPERSKADPTDGQPRRSWPYSKGRCIAAMVYGRTSWKYGRELGVGATREAGQIDTDASTWVRREVPDLRIIPPELAARVDARRS